MPSRDGLIIRLEPEPELSKVIHVQRAHEDLARFGEIVALGPEVRDLKIGQRVLASITAGVELPQGVLVSQKAVLGITHQ